MFKGLMARIHAWRYRLATETLPRLREQNHKQGMKNGLKKIKDSFEFK